MHSFVKIDLGVILSSDNHLCATLILDTASDSLKGLRNTSVGVPPTCQPEPREHETQLKIIHSSSKNIFANTSKPAFTISCADFVQLFK